MKRHRHGGSGSTPMAQFSIIFDCSSSHYLNNQIILLNCCFVHLCTSSSTVRAVVEPSEFAANVCKAIRCCRVALRAPERRNALVFILASALRSAVPMLTDKRFRFVVHAFFFNLLPRHDGLARIAEHCWRFVAIAVTPRFVEPSAAAERAW